MEGHEYLSTGCLHGEHIYCQSMTGRAGPKVPASCKFCGARCQCWCHEEAVPEGGFLADSPGTDDP